MTWDSLIFLYLLGSFYSVVGLIAVYPLRKAWWVISGDEIYIKNMEKIGLCMHPLFGHFENYDIGWVRIAIDLIIAVLLSWVGLYNVLLSALSLARAVSYRVFSEPDSIKQLMLPLRTSLHVEDEAVWARCFCAGLILNGQKPTIEMVSMDLEIHHYLDRKKCLSHLQFLGVDLGHARDEMAG